MISMMLPTMIRYQPKATNPYFVTKLMKNLIASNATMKATTLPTIKVVRFVDMISVPPSMNNLAILYTVAANMVGTARKKENSAAFFRVSFCAIPPTIVAMERDTPGIIEIHWNNPIKKDLFSVKELRNIIKAVGYVGDVLEVKPYGFDARINWAAYLVTLDGNAIGYTNSPVYIGEE